MTNKIASLARETQKDTKPKPTGSSSPVRTVHMNVHITVLWYTIQQRTVLIILPLILQAIIIAPILCTGGEGFLFSDKTDKCKMRF